MAVDPSSHAEFQEYLSPRSAVNATKYDWQRYWCPREAEACVRFDPAGFLLDPDGGFWSGVDTGLSTLPDLHRFGCLALIGEPGIGKSTALAEERDRLRGVGERPIYCDLRVIPDAAGLREKMAEFKEALAQLGARTLLLDSLDECRIEVHTATEMIAEALETTPLRPRVLVCCRSADWPQSFESRLSSLYGEGNTGVYVMAPLRRRDIQTALDAERLDSSSFFNEIFQLRLIPIAIKPLILCMLLAEFGAEGRLGSDQAAVIERGCLKLCEESPARSDTPGHHGNLTPRQRLEIAKRIAATMLLTGREYVCTSPGHDTESGAAFLDDLIYPPTTRSGALEALNTGLFVVRGPAHHGWYHKLPQEFLAARFLAERRLPLAQLRSFFLQGSRIVPQLREAASWLAQMCGDFTAVLASDPEALVAADAQLPNDEARSLVTDSLLGRVAAGHCRLDWAMVDGLSKLCHANLDQQLEAVISNTSSSNVVIETALLIALKCRVAGVAHLAADIALDTTRPLPLRECAAAVVAAVGSISEKRRLRPLASDSQTDDDLKASALAALWPGQLQTEELFAALRPPREIVIGGRYDRFLREVAANLKDSDLLLALEWVATVRSAGALRSTLGELARAIVARALGRHHSPGVLQSLASAAIGLARQGDDLRSAFRRCSAQARLDLLEACLDELRNSELREFYSAKAAGLGPDDIPAALLLASQTENPDKRAAIGNALLYVQGAAGPNIDAFAKAAADDPVLRGAFSVILGPIPLSSPTADHQRHQAQFERDQIRRQAEREQEKSGRLREATAQLHQAAIGEVDAWWRFTLLLSAVRDGLPNEWATDLTKMPGWASLTDADIDQVRIAARNYLENAPDNYGSCATGFERAAIAGIRALRFLADADAAWLSNLRPVHWSRWAGAIAKWPLSQGEENSGAATLVRRFVWQGASDAVAAAIGQTLTEADADSAAFYRLRRWAEYWSPAMEETLLRLASDRKLSAPHFYEVLVPLCVRRSLRGERLARASLRSNNRASRCARAVAAARALVHGHIETHWSAIFQAMGADAEFGRAFVEQSAMEHESRTAGFNLPMRLQPKETAELYVWLVQNYPYRDHPPGFSAVGGDFMAERLRDHALQTLIEQGAADEIQRIRCCLPSLTFLASVEQEAIAERLRRSWQPPNPSELNTMLSDSSKRLVRNGRELRDLVSDCLNEIGRDLQGEHAGVRSLWNTPYGQGATHKTEPEMSAYVANQIDLRLRNNGVAINREVQIRLARYRTDIHVTATSLSGTVLATAKVTVEAKGSWNPDLLSNMRDQLLARYLKGTTCNDGIYLVYWTGEGPPLSDLRSRLEAQATGLSTAAKSINAVVLDCSLSGSTTRNRRPARRGAAAR